jgi:hypothetical protein
LLRELPNSIPAVLVVHVLLRGMITHLGPTHEELFSNLDKEDEWALALKEHTLEYHLPDVYEENELFRQLLGELDDTDLKRIYNFDRDMSFEYLVNRPNPRYNEGSYFSTTRYNVPMQRMSRQVPRATSPNAIVEEISTLTITSQPQLFLLETYGSEREWPASYLGLALGAAREGDFICHLCGTDQAVVVREEENRKYKLVGVAVVAKNHRTVQNTNKGGVRQAFKFAVPYTGERDTSGIVSLYMDLAIAYELST